MPKVKASPEPDLAAECQGDLRAEVQAVQGDDRDIAVGGEQLALDGSGIDRVGVADRRAALGRGLPSSLGRERSVRGRALGPVDAQSDPELPG